MALVTHHLAHSRIPELGAESPAISVITAAAAAAAASVSAGSGAASGWQTPAPTPPATPASHAPPPAPAAPLRQVRIIPDVLPEIFEFLVDATETLHSCALVSHTWRNVVLAVLYARPHFASVWSLRRFTAALARRACLGRWVRWLDLSTIRTTIPPAEFARLFPLVSGVRSVDLSYCRELRDCHVQTLLAQCAQTLTAITLAGNKHLTNASLELIAAHAGVRLRALCIDECHGITDACMQVVASKCTQLVTLKLASTGSLITDASLLALAWPRRARACDSLRTIQLYSCPGVTDASLTLLAQACPHLAAVELYRLPWVTDVSLAEMARHNGSSLRSLCLGEMPNITDTSICEIGRSCDMHSLTLCHCEHITDRGIVELVRHSPNIGFLDIGLVGDITLVSLVATAQCCPRLQDLVVSGNLFAEAIPTRAVMDIVQSIASLDSLTIFQSRDITMDDIESFSARCPNVRCIFVRQCVNITPALAEVFTKTHRTKLVVQFASA